MLKRCLSERSRSFFFAHSLRLRSDRQQDLVSREKLISKFGFWNFLNWDLVIKL